MSFGLGHGRPLDVAPGVIGVGAQELPPLPDDLGTNPEGGRVDPRRWFREPSRALEIEIGCGKGGFLLQQSRAQPGTNFLGIEWAGEFYAYTADRVRRATPALENVRVLHADAGEFLRWRCLSEIVRVIHLYFSDPWPKRRHHKNRVVQDRFLAEVWRVLEPGGELRVVTDHDELWEWDMEHFRRWTAAGGAAGVPAGLAAAGVAPFEMLTFTPPEWVEEGEVVGTNYERKFTNEVKRPHAGVMRKRV
jgi:tRNA (guanine-N7-)-methyltransferase